MLKSMQKTMHFVCTCRSQYAGEKIPTLHEAIALCKKLDLLLLVDVKSNRFLVSNSLSWYHCCCCCTIVAIVNLYYFSSSYSHCLRYSHSQQYLVFCDLQISVYVYIHLHHILLPISIS